jgi:hypothetical protein
MVPGSVRILIVIHMCISLTGVLAHLNQHPVGKSLYFLWASPLSAFSLIVIPVLYYRPSTVKWGFMFNAGTVLIGTIGMAYYSLLNTEAPITVYKILLESTLPAVLILWSKLPVAFMILEKMKPLIVTQHIRGCLELPEKT